MDGPFIANLLIWFVIFVFSTTFHEFGHSVVAHLSGDSTAYEGGQVSLDPLPHMQREPFGMVLLPLLSFFLMGGNWMFGYASAPYDPRWAERNPRKYALMSVAGPAANFFLVIISFVAIVALSHAGVLVFSGGGIDEIVVAPQGTASLLGMVAKALSILLSLNLILGLFNLLPLPPLDGAAVLEGLFPDSAGTFYQRVRSSPGFGFLGLIVAWKVFPFILNPIFTLVLMALYATAP